MWNRSDIDTCNNIIIDNNFMAKDNSNHKSMEDNKINLRMFIISSRKDGSKEKGIMEIRDIV